MRLKIDKESDALYLRLGESTIVESEEAEPGVILDFDKEGKVVGIEPLDLSKRVDPEIHLRHSIRLKGYDYVRAGAYFVTICTKERVCLFGEISESAMYLNEVGRMVQAIWTEMPDRYPGVEIDEFVVMPNHIHGIIVLTGGPIVVGAGPSACPHCAQVQPHGATEPPGSTARPGKGQPRGVAPTGTAPSQSASLGDVVHRFKTLTTKRYTDGVKQHGWPAYRGRVWQRNYHERIVRDDESLNRIRKYIAGNPAGWEVDEENLH